MNNLDALHARAKSLCLHGLLAHWHDATAAGWLHTLIEWEEQERARRSLERRLKDAHIGRFKPLCDFDWSWPKRCDQAAIEALMSLEFLNDATNAILVGPNGVGKSTLAQNIAHQAVIHGHTVLFTTAGQLLGDLAALDSDSTLRRRLRHYVNPTLLVIDEVGYLSYSNRHADLLFELISRRYEHNSTLVTTNRPFAEWREVFPTAACVASLIDRLVHHAEIIAIDGESYRLKEATERSEKRGRQRRGAKPSSPNSPSPSPACHSQSTLQSRHIGRRSRPSPYSNSSTTSETKSELTTASSCSNSAANKIYTPAPMAPTPVDDQSF